MKTSTTMILLTFLVILGCFTAYNFKLKEVYNSKEYRNRFKDMEFTPFSDVENITLREVQKLGVRIEQGNKQGIWIARKLTSNIKFEVNKTALCVEMKDPYNEKGIRYNSPSVIIFTKNLAVVNATSTNEIANYFADYNIISLKDYSLSKLDLQLSPEMQMSLINMHIDTLNALVGNDSRKNAKLKLLSNNQINTAVFSVPGGGSLDLNNPTIIKTVYNISDSAKVTMNGKALQAIR